MIHFFLKVRQYMLQKQYTKAESFISYMYEYGNVYIMWPCICFI